MKFVVFVTLSETCNSLVTILIIGTIVTVVKIRHSEHLASMPGKIYGKYVPEFPLNRLKTLIGCFPISACNENRLHEKQSSTCIFEGASFCKCYPKVNLRGVPSKYKIFVSLCPNLTMTSTFPPLSISNLSNFDGLLSVLESNMTNAASISSSIW